MSATLPLVDRPAHVPAELVVDFDFFRPPGAETDVHRAWAVLQNGPPVVWTPRNGGHWIGTRAHVLTEMQTNHELFSYASINIPRNPTPSLPLEIDPPAHTRLRSVISPLFAPATLKGVEPVARALAIDLIEGFRGRGECEFQGEFARHLPIIIFLKLVDLPLEGRAHLLSLAEKRTRSPIAEERNAAKKGLLDYMSNAIAERRRTPGDDFISRILHSAPGGEPLTDFEAENLLTTSLSGGLDTVASMMGFSMLALASSPQLQDRLINEPVTIPKAVDELIRRHGLANTARLIAHDAVFHGAVLKKGEQIIVPSSLIGLDPDKFDNPFEVDFDRPDAGQHGSFGAGPHRCPGANLARMELRIMLEEWFQRIPHPRIDASKPPVLASGLVSTVQVLRLRWDV